MTDPDSMAAMINGHQLVFVIGVILTFMAPMSLDWSKPGGGEAVQVERGLSLG